jgi:micrococcal nuclease
VTVVSLVVLVFASACAGAAGPTLPTADGIPLRPSGPTRQASLVRVVDGDTIRVVIDGVEERVRYIGIDTPELNAGSSATPDPYAESAMTANARLLAGGRLVLEKDVSERDRYGRLLRDVWIERGGTWTLVNLALVAEGFAQISTYPPDVRYVDQLLAAQAEAREAGRGLWAEPTP